MARRLWYIITWPSAVLATIFALLCCTLFPLAGTRLDDDKAVFCRLIVFVSLQDPRIFKAFQKDDIQYSSLFMRVWNEGATILLFAIVFLVILKSSFHWIFGLLSLLGLAFY